MGIKKYTPYTPSRRNMTGLDFTEITKNAPEKSLTVSLKKNSGRNNQGKITVRHHGGGSRRKYRIIKVLFRIYDRSKIYWQYIIRRIYKRQY